MVVCPDENLHQAPVVSVLFMIKVCGRQGCRLQIEFSSDCRSWWRSDLCLAPMTLHVHGDHGQRPDYHISFWSYLRTSSFFWHSPHFMFALKHFLTVKLKLFKCFWSPLRDELTLLNIIKIQIVESLLYDLEKVTVSFFFFPVKMQHHWFMSIFIRLDSIFQCVFFFYKVKSNKLLWFLFWLSCSVLRV